MAKHNEITHTHSPGVFPVHWQQAQKLRMWLTENGHDYSKGAFGTWPFGVTILTLRGAKS
jgi:hypothetical protein